MEQWSDIVKTSPAYIKAKELNELLAGVDRKQYSTEVNEHVDRVKLVAESVIDRLENNDPRLINPNALANLGNNFTNAVTHVNNWLSGSGENYLISSAEAEMDAALVQLMALAPTQDTPEAREAITKLRRSVAGHVTAVDKLIEQVKAKGSVADASIDEKVAAAQAEFKKLEEEVSELDNDLTKIKDSSSQVTTEQQTAFTKAEASRSAEFTKLLSEKQKELNDSLAAHNVTAVDTVEEIRKSVEADEKKANDARTRIEDILGIVSEEALITDYAKSARIELITSTIWQIVTTISIIGAIGFAIKLSNGVDETTSWQHLISKVVIVLAFGGLAGYAAKQSSEHRTAQRNAERMALQLKALKPYLNDVEDASKRDELLIKIAERFFGGEEMQQQIVDDKGNPILTAQLIEAIIELAKKAAK